LDKILEDISLPKYSERENDIVHNTRNPRAVIYNLSQGWSEKKSSRWALFNLLMHDVLVAEYFSKALDLDAEKIKYTIPIIKENEITYEKVTLKELIEIKNKVYNRRREGGENKNTNWGNKAWNKDLNSRERSIVIGVLDLAGDFVNEGDWIKRIKKESLGAIKGKNIMDLSNLIYDNVYKDLGLGSKPVELIYLGKSISDLFYVSPQAKVEGLRKISHRLDVQYMTTIAMLGEANAIIDELIQKHGSNEKLLKLKDDINRAIGTVKGLIRGWKNGGKRVLRGLMAGGSIAVAGIKQGYIMLKIGQALFIIGAKIGLEMILSNPKIGAIIATTPWLQTLIGAILTTVFLIMSNIDLTFLKTLKVKGIKAYASFTITQVSKNLERLDTLGLVFSFFMGGLSTILKAIGVKFHFPEEVVYVIGDALNMIAEGIGDLWNKIMSFRIPLIDQTIFEVLVGYLLGGPLNTVMGIIIGTILQKLVAPIIDNMITQALLTIIFKI